MGGQIIDASIIPAPRQRMTDEERAVVKKGGIPEAWTAKPARLAQKDRDARWTLKRGRRKKGPDGKLMAEIATAIFGYKSHIGIDQRHGFIRTGSASELPGLIDPANNTGRSIWASTAYHSQKNERAILRAGRVSKIHFRRSPGRPLPAQRQRANAARSKVRSAVEHVFATQNHRMGLFIRTIGIERARAKIGESE
ncbi:MAG: transposase [Sphingomonadaceae bacterium]